MRRTGAWKNRNVGSNAKTERIKAQDRPVINTESKMAGCVGGTTAPLGKTWGDRSGVQSGIPARRGWKILSEFCQHYWR